MRPQSPVQLLLGQKVPAVRELVSVARAGGIVVVLGAGLTGRVEELHEFPEAVGHLGRDGDAPLRERSHVPRTGTGGGLRSHR